MIYILLISLIIIFLISYYFTRKIMSPACIISGIYIVSVYLAILNIETWNIELSYPTIRLIIVGVLSFVLPSIIITLIYFNAHNNHSLNKSQKIKKIKMEKINVDKILLNVLLIIQALTAVIYIYYCSKSLGTGLNLSNFSSKIAEYRALKMVDDDSLFQIPFFVKQMVKISKAIIFCYTFIIINNIVVSKKDEEKYRIPIKWFVMIAFFFIQTIFSASRFDIAILFTYMITIFYLLYFNGASTIKGKMNLKLVAKIFLIILVLGFLFSSTKEFFGRKGDKTTMEYVSSYFGGSIELLDLYMKSPPTKSDLWGKETFFSLNNTLIKEPSEKYTIHLEFRRSNGIWIGNVYTALRMYYQDFGMVGVIILQVIYSILCTLLFLKSLNEDTNKMPLKIILYGVISFTLFLHSYRDFFYSTIISVNYINIFVYIIIIRFMIKKVKIKGLRE